MCLYMTFAIGLQYGSTATSAPPGRSTRSSSAKKQPDARDVMDHVHREHDVDGCVTKRRLLGVEDEIEAGDRTDVGGEDRRRDLGQESSARTELDVDRRRREHSVSAASSILA